MVACWMQTTSVAFHWRRARHSVHASTILNSQRSPSTDTRPEPASDTGPRCTCGPARKEVHLDEALEGVPSLLMFPMVTVPWKNVSAGGDVAPRSATVSPRVRVLRNGAVRRQASASQVHGHARREAHWNRCCTSRRRPTRAASAPPPSPRAEARARPHPMGLATEVRAPVAARPPTAGLRAPAHPATEVRAPRCLVRLCSALIKLPLLPCR